MIRSATSLDIPRALDIYASARQFMRRSGNAVQWVNGYPSEALLRSDVAAGRLFVMEDAGRVYAVFASSSATTPPIRSSTARGWTTRHPMAPSTVWAATVPIPACWPRPWPGRGHGARTCGRIPMRITTPCAAVWNAPASRTPALSASPTAPPAAPTSAYDPRPARRRK